MGCLLVPFRLKLRRLHIARRPREAVRIQLERLALDATRQKACDFKASRPYSSLCGDQRGVRADSRLKLPQLSLPTWEDMRPCGMKHGPPRCPGEAGRSHSTDNSLRECGREIQSKVSMVIISKTADAPQTANPAISPALSGALWIVSRHAKPEMSVAAKIRHPRAPFPPQVGGCPSPGFESPPGPALRNRPEG